MLGNNREKEPKKESGTERLEPRPEDKESKMKSRLSRCNDAKVESQPTSRPTSYRLARFAKDELVIVDMRVKLPEAN